MAAKRVRAPQHHGKPGNRIPDKVKAQIEAACREPGATRNGVARQFGVAAASVSGIAKRAGITFDRSRVKAATEARKVDLAARRSELAAGLLDDVAKLRGQLFAKTTLHAFGGKDNTHNSVDLDEPLYADKLKIVQAYGAAIDRHLKLDAHDSDEHGLAAVDAWLKGMIGD
jgi:transposase-like protein